jgi:hypothetical protein
MLISNKNTGAVVDASKVVSLVEHAEEISSVHVHEW